MATELANSLALFAPREISAVKVVHWKELLPPKVNEMVDAKIRRDAYPFAICVDGMASR